jgi:hypothetical protein
MTTTIDTPRGPISVGARIGYKPFLGGLRMVTVTLVDPDIRNGRPGFEGVVDGVTDPDDAGVWGYADQIIRIYDRGLA